MNVEDLRLRNWYGEGYYSGAGCLVVLAYDINDKEFLEENCKEFCEKSIYLGELDGKHSEVESDEYEDDNDILSVVCNYKDADRYRLDDVFDNKSEVFKKLKKANDFIKKLKVENKYKHKVTGEILNLDEYEYCKEVVSK